MDVTGAGPIIGIGDEMKTPALWHLMGAYLHQDYDYTETIDENIDLFVVKTPDLAPVLPTETEIALNEYGSESELAAFLDDLGCQVLPPDGLTYREWLTQIADRVRAATT